LASAPAELRLGGVEEPSESPRPVLADVSRLTAHPATADAPVPRPTVLAGMRRRAPEVWSSVRRHPAFQAAAARAADLAGVGSADRAAGGGHRRAGSGRRADRLAPVLPLHPPAPDDEAVGTHEAVVIDLARYRASRRPGGRGTA
jgi:hypothetical protein